MLCTIIAQDKPNSLDLRMKVRPTHLAYVEASGVALVFGGPILGDDGATPQGSLIIGEFATLQAAREFAKNDPYALAGLFEKVTVQPTRKVFPVK